MNDCSAPTPHPPVNVLIRHLQAAIHGVLGPRLIGLYLDGSLALGDFDADSDIDFVAVLTEDVAGDSGSFNKLRKMHDAIARLDTPWAIQVEGSYLSAQALRRHDPMLAQHPNIERGQGERLKMVAHGASWDVHRWVLRKCGIVLSGPPPQELIDPVDPEHLRDAMRDLRIWLQQLLDTPSQIASRGYQSYVVLTICRMRYTQAHSVIVTKPAAARWAQDSLGEPWAGLIERAWAGRSQPNPPPDSGDLRLTLAMIQTALDVPAQSAV